MQNLCILIIDDHDLFRTGLNMILQKEVSITTVLEAGSVMNALKHEHADIDAILLDIQMPGLNGLDGIKVLKGSFPNTPIIMLSASSDSGDMQYALELGAAGFLPKSSTAQMIIQSIDKVIDGGLCFPDNKDLESNSGANNTHNSQLNNNYSNTGDEQSSSLTARQLQVLSLMCEGKPNKIIARELELSENTVRVHVSAILSTLDVSSRAEAMLAARKQQLIQ